MGMQKQIKLYTKLKTLLTKQLSFVAYSFIVWITEKTNAIAQ